MILGNGIITQALMGGGSSGGNVKPLTVTENGTYTAPEGYVGFNPVEVNVPQSSGRTSIADLAAMPSFAGIDFGQYRADFKMSVIEGNATVTTYYPMSSGEKEIIINSNRLQISKVISKNGVPLYGDINAITPGPLNVCYYKCINNSDISQGLYRYQEIACTVPGTGSVEYQLYWDGGRVTVYVDMSSTDTIYNVDGSVKSSDENSSHATIGISGVCGSFDDTSTQFVSNLTDYDLAVAIMEASKAFYDAYKK